MTRAALCFWIVISAVFVNAIDAAPPARISPSISYAPPPGSTVTVSPATGGSGARGTASIIATPSGGTGSDTTTVSGCAITGPGANAFGAAPRNLTFAGATTTPEVLAFSCMSGTLDALATLSCNEIGSAAIVHNWPLVCAARPNAPTLSFQPAVGTPINLSGTGTAVGAPANAGILVTPSGGTGSGSAATSTLGSCSITGSGASAFAPAPSSISFIGSDPNPQSLPLSCNRQTNQADATLFCSESRGGSGSLSRSWPISCPAGIAPNVAPTLNFNPPLGTLVALIGSTSGAGSLASASISVTPSGGSGVGSAATTTLANCAINTASANVFGPAPGPLTFVGNSGFTQALALSCTRALTEATGTLNCEQRTAGGTPVPRSFPLSCPAGAPNVPPTVSYVPPPGTIVRLTGSENGVGAVATASIVATPSGGSGSGTSATTTLSGCSISGQGAPFFSAAPGPLSFVGASAAPRTLALSCARAIVVGDATLTCNESGGDPGGPGTIRSWPVVCPVGVAALSAPPNLSYNPPVGTPVNLTGTTMSIGAAASAVITVIPGGGNGSGTNDTTALGACSISGPGAPAFGAAPEPLRFVGNTTSAQNLSLGCARSAQVASATLACLETRGANPAVARSWPINCPSGLANDVAPVLSFSPSQTTLIFYGLNGQADPIIVSATGGSGTGTSATTTFGNCALSPASPAFPTAPNVSFSFVGSNSPPQSLNLPACVPQAAVVNASLTCQEFRASPPNFLRQFNLRCPALAAGPNRPPQGPVSAAISGTVGQGTPAQATITVSDQDNDQLTARIKQQGNNGVCSVTTAATGAFLVTYVPGANVSGALSDTCIVEIADGRGGLLNVTVTVGLAANVPIGALNPTVQAAVMQDPIAGPAAAANQANCASSSDAAVLAQCAAISAATDPATVVAVLRAITGEEASSQVTSSQDSANFVNQGVTGRLGALHGGVRSTLDDVALNFNGKQIPMSALASVLGWQAADEQDAPGGLLDNRLSGFLTGTIRNGERDESGFEVGFDYDGIQVVGGVDYRFSERFVGGAALGYGKVETELGRNAGALDTKTLSGTLYGSYLPSDRLYLDFAFGLLKNDYDQQRTIDLSALGGNFRRTVAISNTRGKQISLSSSVGYNFSRGATSITPNARISYARTDIDGYSELGGGINDLVYPEQDFKSLQFSLGVNLSHAISTSRGVIQPYTNLEFSREQKNDAFSFVPRLRVRPTQGSTPIFIEASDRAFGRAEFGLLFLVEGGWQISTSYTQILGYEDLTARSFQLIGRREF